MSNDVVESAFNVTAGDGEDLDILSIDGGDKQRLELDERGNECIWEGCEVGGNVMEGFNCG